MRPPPARPYASLGCAARPLGRGELPFAVDVSHRSVRQPVPTGRPGGSLSSQQPKPDQAREGQRSAEGIELSPGSVVSLPAVSTQTVMCVPALYAGCMAVALGLFGPT